LNTIKSNAIRFKIMFNSKSFSWMKKKYYTLFLLEINLKKLKYSVNLYYPYKTLSHKVVLSIPISQSLTHLINSIKVNVTITSTFYYYNEGCIECANFTITDTLNHKIELSTQTSVTYQLYHRRLYWVNQFHSRWHTLSIKVGIRTTRYLDISVLNICDISVLGTRHIGTEWKANRYFQGNNNLIKFKNLFCIFFTFRRCLYKFLCVFFLIIFN
jgi:hypothetical protein